MTRYCRHRILTGTVIQGEQRHVFLTTYQQKASPVRSLQFLELFVKKKNKEYQKVSKVSKSIIAEQHPRPMQNNADRPKVRVHHKRKFREITSLPTISIHNLGEKSNSFLGEFIK